MCEFVIAYTKPNGLAPQIGDGDNGRLHILSEYGTSDIRDHRHLIAVGAILFERADWWASTGPLWIEGLWFGGSQIPRWQQPPLPGSLMSKSSAFPDGGFYIMRQNKDYVLFNCNPVGTKGIGTHKHNDLLSIEVHLGGEDIIVDPGTFLYTSDPQAYHDFRGTRVHSTVSVDCFEQNRFLGNKLFTLHPDAKTRTLCWESKDAEDRVISEHEGYARLAVQLVHRRAVTFNRPTGRIDLLDSFMGRPYTSDTHTLIWTFMFDRECAVEPVQEGWLVRTTRQQLLLSSPVDYPDNGPLPVESRVDKAWVATRYGVREQTQVLYWMWRGKVPLAVKYSLDRAAKDASISLAASPENASTTPGRGGENVLRSFTNAERAGG
jgi:hypothetical protein